MQRVGESCAKCLLDRQGERINKDEDKKKEYLKAIEVIIENRDDDDCAPYLVYLFQQKYREIFGEEVRSFADEKRKYNDLVMDMLPDLQEKIDSADDPLAYALFMARIGNYIDFGAMTNVDENEFLSLFDNITVSDADRATYAKFIEECAEAKNFLLIADNAGEIILDILFIQALKTKFRDLDVIVLVRGEETSNDVTMEDAYYVGLHNVAWVTDNGNGVAGTVYKMCPPEVQEIIDGADVILAKGQGNYESLNGTGKHVYYSFLCKCDMFTSRFNVEKLTGMFISE